jgi:NADH:ubiquinone reductase (H+-translocating)
MDNKGRHVVVLGAGFGGLKFCQTFHSPQSRITLVDRQNHHLFQPLLYQVATAGLAAPDIAQPVRSILSDRENITVLLDEVREIDLDQRLVSCERNRLTYDFLVLGLGGVTSYFGHPEWEQFAPGLKTLDDALRIRRDILLAFEHAEDAPTAKERERLMTIVVVGGGPTGVELAGAFAELAWHVLEGDFRHINPRQARIILIEAGDRVLANLPPELSASAEDQLRGLGVEILKNRRVQNIAPGCVEVGGEVIHAENIVWAAGVSATPLTAELGAELDRAGRVRVLPDLSVPGHPEVFVIGDMASVLDKHGNNVPGVSPAAMQMAKHVARIIEDEIEAPRPGLVSRPSFSYWDRGTMATIGRSAAVAQIDGLKFSGFPAWLAWLTVHLVFLIGFRNKTAVFFNWIYSYLTYKRGMRIVTGMNERPETSGRRGWHWK